MERPAKACRENCNWCSQCQSGGPQRGSQREVSGKLFPPSTCHCLDLLPSICLAGLLLNSKVCVWEEELMKEWKRARTSQTWLGTSVSVHHPICLERPSESNDSWFTSASHTSLKFFFWTSSNLKPYRENSSLLTRVDNRFIWHMTDLAPLNCLLLSA